MKSHYHDQACNQLGYTQEKPSQNFDNFDSNSSTKIAMKSWRRPSMMQDLSTLPMDMDMEL